MRKTRPNGHMAKRVQATIIGRVQGVFFRVTTQKQATTLGLKGFVRNLTDGSVSLEAEGEEELLNQLLRWCHEGPSGARVDEVKVNWITPLNQESEFSIKT